MWVCANLLDKTPTYVSKLMNSNQIIFLFRGDWWFSNY
jgi:hypothetical protein